MEYPKRGDPYSFGLGKRSAEDTQNFPIMYLRHPRKRTDRVAWGFLDPKQHKSDPYAFGLGK